MCVNACGSHAPRSYDCTLAPWRVLPLPFPLLSLGVGEEAQARWGGEEEEKRGGGKGGLLLLLLHQQIVLDRAKGKKRRAAHAACPFRSIVVSIQTVSPGGK